MTDHPPPPDDSGAEAPSSDPISDPTSDAAVRRLLGQARHDGGTPPDVTARLERALADLDAERTGTAGPGDASPHDPPHHEPGEASRGSATVVDLGARRRRRATALLAAAAVVVVAALGVSRLLPDDDPTSTSSAGGQAESDSAGRGTAQAQPEPGPGEAQRLSPSGAPTPGAPTDSDGLGGSGRESAVPSRDPVRLTEAGFADQVERLRGVAALRADSEDLVGGDDLSDASGYSCPAALYGPGRLLPARYDGAAAVLVFRPVRGSTQVVELFQCGTGEVVRSLALPVR